MTSLALSLPLQFFAPTPAIAQATPDTVTLSATVDGTPVGNDDLVLDPTGSARISVTVHNRTDTVRHVKTVRLSGTALALTFFSYDTTVPFDVPAKESVTKAFVLDLTQLGTQATGLLPTDIEVLDVQRDVIATISTTGDVRGSVWSVYGIFGIAVFALTALAWIGALWALARRRLPANRWQRAMQFLPAGIGTGLVAVISLSVLRVMAPSPAAEIPFILGAAAAAFALGYLTPHPHQDHLHRDQHPHQDQHQNRHPHQDQHQHQHPPIDPEATQRITRPLPGGAA
ncbi:FlaG/FlaF family flagellin (archaellin) [Saccharothrix tamanrassetensis]|uniref:FlaG/FlaF family flagellin (Archaellin) n=1 Tax=Saccharothrix tamanrassetensis TaxID=1051531 RepID=A0A841CPE5_9PSEU|nr:hypothetical protein [Saccharothrix tamanrassetensis]MBB5959060.1 FlaG/FlaF family flagellin (archaellin) [Saccharothrix tamanrassetensis]